MSRGGQIGYAYKDGSVTSVYLHFEATVQQAGQILHKCYNKSAAAREIVKLGAVSYLSSSLFPKTGIPHTFNNPQSDVSVFYHRDRGEPLHKSSCRTVEEYRDLTSLQYVYLWINKEWHVSINEQGFFPLRVLFEVDWIARQ